MLSRNFAIDSTGAIFRGPQWRKERVLELIGHRPRPLRPRRGDDLYIRLYRGFLLDCTAAGAYDDRRAEVFAEYPDVALAQQLHFSPELDHRQILEARLLTGESFEAISQRFEITEKVVEYYHAIFFDVRDRLNKPDWIRANVLRQPCGSSKDGEMTVEQRGFVYRLVAYRGGSHALDAVLNAKSGRPIPESPDQVNAWFANEFDQNLLRTATIATNVLPVDQRNGMKWLELAAKQSAMTAKEPDESMTQYDKHVKKALEGIEFVLAEKAELDLNELEQRVSKTPIEPTVEDAIQLREGIMPKDLQRAVEQYEAGEGSDDRSPSELANRFASLGALISRP
jgi:hypothetical protein